MSKQVDILANFKDFLLYERRYSLATTKNNYFFILNFLKECPLPFTFEQIGRYVSQMKSDGKSRYYINCCLCYIRNFFDYCNHKGIKQEDFTFRLKYLRERVGNEIDPHKFLTNEQITILREFDKDKDYSQYQYPNLERKMDLRFKMFINFVYFTGCRGNEAACLRKKDICFDSHEVVFVDSKNGQDRVAQLSETIETMLLDFTKDLKDNDWVFPSHIGHSHVNPKKMSFRLNKIARKLIGKRVTMHMLRHTLGSLCHQHKMPLLFVKEQLGHKRIESTMRYMHADKREIRNALQNCNPQEVCNQTTEILVSKIKDFIDSLNLEECKLPYKIINNDKKFGLIVLKH